MSCFNTSIFPAFCYYSWLLLSSPLGSNDAPLPRFPANLLHLRDENPADIAAIDHKEGVYSKRVKPKLAWAEEQVVPLGASSGSSNVCLIYMYFHTCESREKELRFRIHDFWSHDIAENLPEDAEFDSFFSSPSLCFFLTVQILGP